MASAARIAAFATWRTLHPAARGRFVECPAPRPLERLYYETADGWRAPLFALAPRPGAPGEPVVVAHALGVGGDGFRYGRGPTLADALTRAGFSVYLLAHRGDAHALPPRPRAEVCFDHVVERDLPAALARVAAHSGCPRALWVGHGLGGQLGLALASRREDALAGVAALCAAVRFLEPVTEARRAAVIAGLLPGHWRVPARALARVAAPFVEAPVAARVSPEAPASRLRGVLEFASEDVAVGLLSQASTWLRVGSLTDRTGSLDYREALVDARVPLLVASSPGDSVCSPAAAEAALDHWGHPDASALRLPAAFGHLDPILATAAAVEVFEPVCRWLEARRSRCWGEIHGETVALTA